ncbi:hypothetical protein [Streptomyces albireticuli]|uniref:hypothetical protein n=1 Tax=Streptomyces albireticuli TaxID=1940 RepID=UPI001474A8BC|nr:hypothetical protein [Streptomyces albireticuli]MCD9142387.1 hypothetical protein [Streptomyces albireticuli]MCD9166032.1 hypothetical protein [Streptomyces albireticuli]MCD9192515.1 hypothetical protein [Streptomyces albireticuli]
MFGKKSQCETEDLTTPEAVARGQKVYDRIVAGKCKDVEAELDAVHCRGRQSKRAS